MSLNINKGGTVILGTIDYDEIFMDPFETSNNSISLN